MIGQKLEQVADLVYEKGHHDASPQETVSGEIVAITDISPIEHNVAVKASSKNLLPYPYKSTTKTTSGITYIDNGDGSVSVEGTATEYTMFYFTEEFPFKVGQTYTFGEDVVGTDMYVRYKDENGATKYAMKNVTWKEGYTLLAIYLQVNPGSTTSGTVYPYLIEGDTYDGIWTPYVPDVSAATVKTLGKNLFNNDTSLLKKITYNNASGSQTKVGYELSGLPAGNYTFTLTELDNSVQKYVYGAINDKDGNYIRACNLIQDKSNLTPFAITINEGDKIYIYDAYSPANVGASGIFNAVQIQLEAGYTATPYEPYIQPTSYPIATDGTADVTSIYPNMTITTDTNGVVIDANYYQDGKKVKENLNDMILSLGGVINE